MTVEPKTFDRFRSGKGSVLKLEVLIRLKTNHGGQSQQLRGLSNNDSFILIARGTQKLLRGCDRCLVVAVLLQMNFSIKMTNKCNVQ